MHGWYLTAMFILVAFGWTDGVLRQMGLAKAHALTALGAWILLPGFLPAQQQTETLTLLMTATAAVYFIFYLTKKNRLYALRALLTATAVTVLLRVLLPVESGQIAFSINWFWGPAVAACALACTSHLGAAFTGALLAMPAQSAAYSLLARPLGRFEPMYIGGGFELLMVFVAIAFISGLLYACTRAAVTPGDL